MGVRGRRCRQLGRAREENSEEKGRSEAAERGDVEGSLLRMGKEVPCQITDVAARTVSVSHRRVFENGARLVCKG